MRKLKISMVAAAIFSTSGMMAHAEDLVSNSKSLSEFTEQFCGASRTGEHIFVLPLKVFETSSTITCDFGKPALRLAEPSDDLGHYVLNIDPPSGVEDGFDCDGKADKGMAHVALNCLPANMENASHTKS